MHAPTETSVKVIADSISSSDCRLTTFVLTYPRIIHSEFLTARLFSRNASSSRAIPVEKMLENTRFTPKFYANRKGMQSGGLLENQDLRQTEWGLARMQAKHHAINLAHGHHVHKSIANRLLEPFSYITVIVTATEWDGFFLQRANEAAQPEFQELAHMMLEAMNASVPASLKHGEWHLPFCPDASELEDSDLALASSDLERRICIARCARVSYLTHDGVRDPRKDIDLYEKLLFATPTHWSPFEHVATPTGVYNHDMDSQFYGNFRCWQSMRYQIEEPRFPVDPRLKRHHFNALAYGK